MQNFLITLIVVLLILSFSNSKLQVHKIILKHIATLRNDKTNRVSIWDITTLLFFPFIVAGILTFVFKIFIDDINVLLTVFSIFAALLFNFLMLVIQMKEEGQAKKEITNVDVDMSKYYQCVSETYYNVSFAILVSIIEIVLLLLISMLDVGKMFFIINMITWALMIIFFLDLIMILKRVFIIYNIKL